MECKVFIDGEAGTTGLKVAERLQQHPLVQILRVDEAYRKDAAARADIMAASDITILCLPDDAALEAVTLAEPSKTRLIDASSAHRTNPDWVYGFAELQPGQRDAIATARLITNPGCYPTGFLALARPLIASGLVADTALINVPAVSGFSGGGKAMIARHDAGELDPAFSYGTNLQHKHLGEMTVYSGLKTPPIFMPSVGDFFAGMLVHLPLHADQFAGAVTAEKIYDFFADWYGQSNFVRMGAGAANHQDTPSMLAADALAGRNDMELFVFSDTGERRFWLTARLDNLGKGASGAAVQNMNIALGLDEGLGLL
ncbi:MAG: N-acetyl-gamma-glutamyl-phosphate reductase [Candidatus Puniceispirillaceae bacterium]